ncbi:MAG: hypothetical protein HKP58_02455 [Desulfatitalea sp.]|nr:hypothetical protein [Desulfatitalea sp.]NNJ99251.1 hypothetical protein [Desulfatitalea sp.]
MHCHGHGTNKNQRHKENDNEKKVDKEDWLAMFRDIGMTDEAMMKWHQLFEKRHPESHEDFLIWLAIPFVDKKMWVNMMEAAGMDESSMARWHSEFERRAPKAHKEFLMSLGILKKEVQKIQEWSRESKLST